MNDHEDLAPRMLSALGDLVNEPGAESALFSVAIEAVARRHPERKYPDALPFTSDWLCLGEQGTREFSKAAAFRIEAVVTYHSPASHPADHRKDHALPLSVCQDLEASLKAAIDAATGAGMTPQGVLRTIVVEAVDWAKGLTHWGKIVLVLMRGVEMALRPWWRLRNDTGTDAEDDVVGEDRT